MFWRVVLSMARLRKRHLPQHLGGDVRLGMSVGTGSRFITIRGIIFGYEPSEDRSIGELLSLLKEGRAVVFECNFG